MTINDVDLFVRSLWDWNILDGCFGCSGIAVADLDGIIERRGRFLVLESKGAKTPVKEGQRRLLKALQALGKMTIIVIWGHPGRPERAQLYDEDGRVTCQFPCDLEHLRILTTRWYEAANCGQAPEWRWTKKDEEGECE